MANLPEMDVYKKTIYAEARGECMMGQKYVAWVIKIRAYQNKSYWGGSKIKDVCLHGYGKDGRGKGQFECWNGPDGKIRDDILIEEPDAYESIGKWLPGVYNDSIDLDPTKGSDHYNNPDKEGYPAWTNNCDRTEKIGNHQFYRSKDSPLH